MTVRRMIVPIRGNRQQIDNATRHYRGRSDANRHRLASIWNSTIWGHCPNTGFKSSAQHLQEVLRCSS
jgi:hypothetical protein